MIRVRFPPSPTGIPHIGNTRTALFNYLFAKHNEGSFILRIEDTDRARIAVGAEEAIKEILSWLGLTFDEFYKQSERLDLYKKASEELIEKGFAKKEEGAVRFIVGRGKKISWEDAVGEKTISFNTDDLEDFIILKSDEFPTYHLANVVDDHHMQISHVIRGDEWISSTPKHILLYKAFGWKHPIFAHLPVILGSDHQKLSKRHGAKSALDYKEEGYLPQALLNFMALLGWNPGEDREIMSMDEMIELFDLKEVNTAPSIFDATKLDWMNGVYIRKSQISNLKSQIIERMPQIKNVNNELLEGLIELSQSRMKTLNDFHELAKPVLEMQNVSLDEKEKNIAKEILDRFSNIKEWNSDKILAILKEMTNRDVNMQIFYKIFTGQTHGLPLPDVLELLGKDEVIRRLKKYASGQS